MNRRLDYYLSSDGERLWLLKSALRRYISTAFGVCRGTRYSMCRGSIPLEILVSVLVPVGTVVLVNFLLLHAWEKKRRTHRKAFSYAVLATPDNYFPPFAEQQKPRSQRRGRGFDPLLVHHPLTMTETDRGDSLAPPLNRQEPYKYNSHTHKQQACRP